MHRKLVGTKRMTRTAVAALAMTLAIPAAGCFGRFEITRNLYAFNRTVSHDRFARWGVFLAMNVAPMYPVGLALDAFVANPIEFWSGRNPVKGSPRWFPQPDSAARDEGRCDALRVVREADALAAYDACGELVARVTDVDGRATIVAGSARSR